MSQSPSEVFKTPLIPEIQINGEEIYDENLLSSKLPTPIQPNSAAKPSRSKSNSSSKPRKPKQSYQNPYDHIANSYSHEATTVPPYVLYGIANSDEMNQTTKKINDPSNTLQDPFISSLNNNWGKFFKTVDSTPAYSEGVLQKDIEAFKELPNLSGKWGGDARLKSYLNHDHADLEEFEKKMMNHSNDSASELSSYHKDVTRSKSKAKYWMSTEHREEWTPYFQRILISNNYLTLFFRLLTIVLSAIALALSTHIYRLSDSKAVLAASGLEVQIPQQASTVMAITVQSTAMVYLFYITYDEFYSKPIGIRNPVEKIRLILLDLLFIIFSSANLTLSFHSTNDEMWVCSDAVEARFDKINEICNNQNVLCAFLFVILAMWVITFTISILRVIQKVSGPQ